MPDAWIRPWGDPALREVAAPLATADELVRRQVARMQRMLEDVGGAGLAATQVGMLRRVFAYRMDAESPAEVLVNPVIVARSPEFETFLEGCLSFNTVLVEVVRPAAVRVEGFDLEGRAVAIDAEGFAASLLQHEIDHLDGILTLDRATPEERRQAVAALMAEERLAA